MKRVVVYGGRGALGAECVKFFKSNDWWVGSVDLVSNDDANGNVIIRSTDSLATQEEEVVSGVDGLLAGEKVDVVICVAGGWAGGSINSDDAIKNTDLMMKQSLWSSVIAAKLASKYLRDGGLLTLTGAKAALEPTPGMLGYGLAKAAVHHLTKSLSGKGSGLPKDATVVAILPVTLDTPMNRKFMPKADFSTWTPLSEVAELFLKWSDCSSRPASGSLVQLVTAEGKTEQIID